MKRIVLEEEPEQQISIKTAVPNRGIIAYHNNGDLLGLVIISSRDGMYRIVQTNGDAFHPMGFETFAQLMLASTNHRFYQL